MAIAVPSKEIVSKITKYIEEARCILQKVEIDVASSLDSVPNEIKNKVTGEYSDLNSELSPLITDCETAIDGIEKCVSAYMLPEVIGIGGMILPQGINSVSPLSTTIGGQDLRLSSAGEVPSKKSNFNSSGVLSRVDREFFIGLEKNGKGTFDEANNTYVIEDENKGITYKYNVGNGKLSLNDKSSKVVFGIYVPEDATNLSKLDTITFLHGNEYEGGIRSFDPKLGIVESCLTKGSTPADTIMIFPQADTSTDRSNGFMPYKSDVVAGTEFVKLITDQDSDRNNALFGFSSGVKSGIKIAATDGKDTYDTFVGINGYAGHEGKTLLTESDAQVLNQKNVVFWSSQGDAHDQSENGKAWQNRTESIVHMSEIGLEAEFHTNNQVYEEKLRASSYTNIHSIENHPGFNGHGPGCEYAIKELDVLNCFK